MRGRPKGREKVDLHLSIDATLHARVTDLLPKNPVTNRVQQGELARLTELLLADWLRNNQRIITPRGESDDHIPGRD